MYENCLSHIQCNLWEFQQVYYIIDQQHHALKLILPFSQIINYKANFDQRYNALAKIYMN